MPGGAEGTNQSKTTPGVVLHQALSAEISPMSQEQTYLRHFRRGPSSRPDIAPASPTAAAATTTTTITYLVVSFSFTQDGTSRKELAN